MKRLFAIHFFVLFFTPMAFAAGPVADTFTIDGQLYLTGTTTTLSDSSANVNVKIYNPAGTCLLYEEAQTVNTTSSNGYFNIEVGSATGSGKRTGSDPGRTMLQIYQNTSAISGSSCTYTPSSNDTRIVRVTVTPSSTGTPDVLTPDITLNSMPMAKVAESIQGIVPASLLQVNSSGTIQLTQANLEAAFTGSAYTNLQAVLAGNVLSGSSGTAASPSLSFSGDSNTGFFSAGADLIGISTGGTQIFVVGSSGMVSSTTGGASVSTANGTAAAPTFSFAGDTGTGWYRPAASTLAASTSGTEKIRIDVSGNVGIGTTSPASKLDVAGDIRLRGTTSGYVAIKAPASVTTPVTWTLPNGDGTSGQVLTTDGSGILSWAAAGSGSTIGLGVGSSGAPSISFSGDTDSGWYHPAADTLAAATGGVERVRIDPSGYVGIGTTSAAGNLHILGTGATYIDRQTTAAHLLLRSSRGTVGAPAAQAADEVIGRLSFMGYDGTNYVTANNTGVAGVAAETWTGTNQGTYLTFSTTPIAGTTAAERARINSSGYLGIGTTAPGSALDVKGTVRISGATSGYVGLAVTAAAGSTTYTLPAADGTSGQVLTTDGTGILSWANAGTSAIAVGSSGAPSIAFSGDTDTGWWHPAADTMAASTGGSERARISSAGYFGIGTTNPGSALDVKGDIRLTGATSGYVGIKSPASVTTPVTWTLPNGDGTAGQVLSTDGTGILSWVTAGGSTTSLAVGSSGAPSIAFSGDSDTGWYHPAADTLAATTAGSERVRIDPSGYVGIGTTSPQAMLTIGSGSISNADAPFQMSTGASGSEANIAINKNGAYGFLLGYKNTVALGSYNYTGGYLRQVNTDPFSVVVNSNTVTTQWASDGSIGLGGSITDASHTGAKVLIDSSGRVGIGTTAPAALLDIGKAGTTLGTMRLEGSTSGYLQIQPTAAAGSWTMTLPGSAGSSGQMLTTDGTGVLSWTTPGTVTTSTLGVGTSAAPSLTFSGDTDTGWYHPAADILAATTAGSERVRISSTGALGIGTTSPTSALQISNQGLSEGTAAALTSLIYQSQTSNARSVFSVVPNGSSVGTDIFLFSTSDTATNYERLVFGYDWSGYWHLSSTKGGTGTVHPMFFDATGSGSPGTANLFLSTSGQVGVGVTTPAAKLDVNGDIRLRGATSGYVGIQAPASVTTPVTWTLPNGDGSAGQMLVTSGTGALSWTTPGSVTTSTVGAGSVGSPSLTFSGDTDTGFYNVGANQIGVSASGANIFTLSASGMVAATTGGGSVSTANGTAAAPTFSFAGDTDTGWFRPAADTLAASTSGTEKMRIDPSGYVGIATTSPSFYLDVAPGVSSAIMRVGSWAFIENVSTGQAMFSRNAYYSGGWKYANTGYASAIRMYDDPGDGSIGFHISASGTAGNSITNMDGSDRRMTIRAGGNVGIGTSSPITAGGTASKNLQLEGTDYAQYVSSVTNGTTDNKVWRTIVRSTASGSPVYQIQSLDDSGNSEVTALQITRSGNSVSYVSFPNGNVGIGTTAPNYPLTVNGAVVAGPGSTAGPAYMFYPTATYGATGMYAPAANSIGFVTSANERMRIDPSGYVGIGTTSPSSNLEVYSSSSNSILKVTGPNTTYKTIEQIDTTSGKIWEWSHRVAAENNNFNLNYYDGASWHDGYIALKGDGSVGIGTTNPTSNLQIGTLTSSSTASPLTLSLGGTYSSTAGANSKLKLYDDGTNIYGLGVSNGLMNFNVPSGNGFSWYINGAEKMRIDPSGYVGIGTTNPSQKLEIHTTNNGGDFQLRLQNESAGAKYFNVGPSDSGNNFAVFNQNGTGVALMDGATSWSAISDRRLKTNIQPLTETDGIDTIMKLNPVTYHWKEKTQNSQRHLGFIAQEVQAVIPDLVSVTGTEIKAQLQDGTEEVVKDPHIVDYTNLVVPVIKAIQQLKVSLDSLFNQVTQSDRNIASLKAENEQLKAKVEKTEKENSEIKSYLCSKDPSAPICR